MILYFTGTGNSGYIAKIISEKIDDQVISINNRIKENNFKELKSKKPFVIVCPTYAWRMPRLVSNFLEKVKLSGNNNIYFVLTCGGDSGKASYYAEFLCIKKKMKYMGLCDIVMPENYITMYNAPSKAVGEKIITQGKIKAEEIAEIIKSGKELKLGARKVGSRLKSDIVNPIFYKFFVTSKGFYTSDQCTKCKRCITLCPLNNIDLKEGKIVWGDKCTQCMACICGCPSKAIEYRDKTQNKERYYLNY